MAPKSYSTRGNRHEQLPKGAAWQGSSRVHAMTGHESARSDVAQDAVWLPGGSFRMGSDRHYPEEAPSHLVRVDGFWIDRYPVTNRDFRRFVDGTGYVTFAEIAPDLQDYPGALPEMLFPASLVFTQPGRPVDLRDFYNWWVFKRDANWRQPDGPGSSIEGKDDHPVVHVAYRDAEAYAAWVGRGLPTGGGWADGARGGAADAQ
jgi:formylglycine-generating enzyme required for sulfatase activity